MELTVIEAKTLPDAWFQCIRGVMDTGYEYVIDKGSFAGQKRKEFDQVVVKVEYPGSRPLVPDTPQGIPPPATMEYVEEYLPYLMTDVKKEGEIYTYGEDLSPQLPEVIRMYREGGYGTNKVCMSVGNSHSIFLEHSQCLRLIDTRVRYGKLHFVVYFRSWDLWAGFPSNLAAIQIMKEYLADEIGVEDGELVAFSKGLHLYDHCWDLANVVLRKKVEVEVESVEPKIIRAERSFGTDRVMVYGTDGYLVRLLSGRGYNEVKTTILELSDSKTKFYHRIPSEDPTQPVKEVEISKEEW